MEPIQAGAIDAARVAVGITGLLVAIAWERRRSAGGREFGRWRRDLTNVGLWAVNAGVLRLTSAALSVGAAIWAGRERFGVLAQLEAPRWVDLVLTLLVLDAIAYALHRLYHRSALLWRFHRVHHSDADLRATTSVRFHAIEVLLSATARLPLIVVLGADAVAVAAFDAALLLASQLQHADVRLPSFVDTVIRGAFVTPCVHRIHHSKERTEADSNYGTIFTWWDRALGTYRIDRAPEQVRTGLPGETDRERGLVELLAMPFGGRSPAGAL